ncbi:SMI1/KNR4 family protein [Chitinimonas arctica]|uniref:SMI1/KNR4 family protein n=1 Tax=Chitinimonas arctica TaxID=2594795 RepID=A0A516SJ73_9NEIS|nr:SMI1/KNR4 family protein [Chitinimonas arctica]QDQ28209.1 SMI1/KNR4 family protein [Chitinimonas arctica]
MDEKMVKDFDTEPGASGKAIENAEADLNWQLPTAYKQLLEKTNGGKGTVGENYVVLWSAEELAEINREYQVQAHAPGLVLFGSDGEGQGFAFDTRQAPYPVVQVPLIGMDLQNARVVAPEFAGFIGSLR